MDDINTTKKLCFDNEESMKETKQFNKKTDGIHSFYGLPVVVKQLIHKIKGFNKLYSKYNTNKQIFILFFTLYTFTRLAG